LVLSTARARVTSSPDRRTLLARGRVSAAPWTLALIAVIVAAAVLRLYDLGSRSLWVDELFSVGLAAQDPRTILAVLYGEEANMTLYYLVMFAWIRLVGGDASEAWMRLPSVLFGLASLWALYKLGAELDGPLTGLIAALLAGTNAYHVGMSQEARAYTLWALLATLSWLSFVRSLDGGRRDWQLYTLATALAFWAHFFTVFVVLAQGLVVLIRMRRAELRSLILSGLGVGVLCLPFAPFFLLNSDGSQILHVRRSDLSDLRELFWLFGGASTQVRRPRRGGHVS
jgi:mannosyltransferase